MTVVLCFPILFRVVLLTTSVLIWVACAIPFARLKLEEGMTQDEVRALAGEPKTIWTPDTAGKPPTKPDADEEAWGYDGLLDEIALYFEGGRLTRWKVTSTSGSSDSSSPGTLPHYWSHDPFWWQSNTSIDSQHHRRGHKHHHDHDC